MGRLQYFFLGWGSVYICRHVYFSGIQKHVLSVTLCCVPALIVNIFKEAATVCTLAREKHHSLVVAQFLSTFGVVHIVCTRCLEVRSWKF